MIDLRRQFGCRCLPPSSSAALPLPSASHSAADSSGPLGHSVPSRRYRVPNLDTQCRLSPLPLSAAMPPSSANEHRSSLLPPLMNTGSPKLVPVVR
uniref:Uncharacterized protein n=1 Tax=Oryza sativa subsp. japonica TaxID=39947 RepID=Q656B2_ORYSJ|nr:hypothetical protein [Oryza sativa Japonica Group]BAD45355.1 hypothetical protein [Oryza sativa Japonica Group]